VTAAGLSSSSLVVSLLVCRVDQTAVSTGLSMQCHVRTPEPSPGRDAATGGQKMFWYATQIMFVSRVVSCTSWTGLPAARLPGLASFLEILAWPSWAFRESASTRHIRGLLSRDGCTASLEMLCKEALCAQRLRSHGVGPARVGAHHQKFQNIDDLRLAAGTCES